MGHFEVEQGTGSCCKFYLICNYHIKEQVKMSHLTLISVVSFNKNQVMDYLQPGIFINQLSFEIARNVACCV